MLCEKCGVEAIDDVCPKCGEAVKGSPKWYVQQIAALGEQQQFDSARSLLYEGLRQYPTSALLMLNAGVLEEVVGNTQAAITHYQELLQIRPNSRKAQQALERLLNTPTPPAPSPVPLNVPSATPVQATATPELPIITMPVVPTSVVPAQGGAMELPPMESEGLDLATLPEITEAPLSKAEMKAKAKADAKAKAMELAAAKAEARAAMRAQKMTDSNKDQAMVLPGAEPVLVLPSQATDGSRRHWSILSRLCGILAIISLIMMFSFFLRGMDYGLYALMSFVVFFFTTLMYYIAGALAKT